MWSTPPNTLSLTPSDVHLWCMSLELSSPQVNQRFEILSDDEQGKAKRFRFEQHQRRFIVARSTLKIILSRYLETSPHQIQLEYSSYGKPKLAEEIGGSGLQFNVSHSQELAIYGITRDRLLGVDLEYIRPMPEADQLAKRFFSPKEYERIRPLDSPQKEQAFFQLWTAKEAYLKAIGEGIGGGLDQVEVSLDTPIKFVNLPQNKYTAFNWTLSSLVPQTDYLAAVAVQGHECQLSCWQF